MKHTCKDITELISLESEQKLAFSQKTAINIHLLFCPYCRAFKKNNQQMRVMMKQFRQREEK